MTQITTQPNQATLPVPDPTRSYWHAEPSARLLGHRTTTELPAEADVVVVGAGVTGAFAARELVLGEGGNGGSGGRRVVCLEAREVCWGATGRVSRFFPFFIVTTPFVSCFFSFLFFLFWSCFVACERACSLLRTAAAASRWCSCQSPTSPASRWPRTTSSPTWCGTRA